MKEIINKVAVIIFKRVKDDYQFLLLKTIPKENMESFWQCITGKVDNKDKSILDAAYRETKEEACVDKIDILRVIEGIYYYETEDKDYLIKEYVFAFEVKNNSIVCLDKNIYKEHIEYKWCSFKKAINLLKWDNNKEAFNKLNKII